MRILAAAHDDGVDDDENSEENGQHRLYGYECHPCHGFGALCHAELLHKDDDTNHRQRTHHLNDDVDPITRLRHKWATPYQQAQHQGFDDQLSARLEHAMSVAGGDDAAPRKHIQDSGNENPPQVLLVLIVEQGVLDPYVLVLVQCMMIALCLSVPPRQLPDFEGEEGQHGSEDCE